MSRWLRAFLIVFTFLMACLSLTLMLMFFSESMMNLIFTFCLRLARDGVTRTLVLIFLLLLFTASLAALTASVMSARLRRARVRANTIGSIDVGVDAIESIALNAAKASQSGVKAAKARIPSAKGDKLNVFLNVMAYSDVELPAMMSRVQERVKKDIERFTGIEVAEVTVRVARVDAIAARIEH